MTEERWLPVPQMGPGNQYPPKWSRRTATGADLWASVGKFWLGGLIWVNSSIRAARVSVLLRSSLVSSPLYAQALSLWLFFYLSATLRFVANRILLDCDRRSCRCHGATIEFLLRPYQYIERENEQGFPLGVTIWISWPLLKMLGSIKICMSS